MHFFIQKSLLNYGVQHAFKAVATRTTIPILTGIKIEATTDSVSFVGSDSDISIQCKILNETDEKTNVKMARLGSIVAPAKFFTEIVRKLPGDEVEIQVHDQLGITIRSGQAEFNLNGMDPEEYPKLPELIGSQSFRIPSSLLKTMIRQTVFSAASTETRPILTGVKWDCANNMLAFTATNSHRLSYRQSKIEAADDLQFDNIVVPAKSCNELHKILEDDDRLVDVMVTNNQLYVRQDEIMFYSRLLEGNYPETKRLIPQTSQTEIIVDTDYFLAAIERVALLSRDSKSNVVKLSIEGSQLELMSYSPEIGKAVERLDANESNGEPLKISFNAQFMLDALRAIDSDEVRIGFSGAMRPFVLHAKDHQWVTQLILPLRTL
ncbi:DNA polymerase III subunit beta [Rubeoparvulum massiliense]|uniref:DNA polymerase III subunit beta n=1 Tax=Rubeoparvulum massiliense TaxID=1631346 RepID=UPI00065DEC25|nr:DNA polymerase III subunit beta [Rubeoparvulum massiliense]